MRLLKTSSDEAVRLGHHWVGPEHTLLAILRGEPGDRARQALEGAGVDASMVERWLDRMNSGPDDDSRSGVSPNPRWYGVYGRAEGFAAALGNGEVQATDFVLAVLWDARRWTLTEEPGITREAIVEGLVQRGVSLPAAPLPDLERQRHFTQRVEFPLEAADRVIQLLVERHPPGSGPSFGYNTDAVALSWVFAEDGIDLQSIVDEALSHEPEPGS